ncbi:probable U3 small nucleolar RNA-associated protein 11 [Thrips palmi]|uniref:U3 small nucleolar RNA-associated protein 11 n=1 Tax=Thrips palmi TaxID=161013 RepID=A0A6P8ZP10_THRPL|nr:probable U3 small nucleolar RNA-associated protein 11 [Thrips palmi]XP_034243289.1 probable U3 small nucleolar RNA-associated protein 11 [Thrips palmi]
MSSWKSVSKSNQKTHRERHQPEARSHLGLLEKKKDYKTRADDFNEKQKTLRLLRKRALNRNPDEFYFHMINSKTEDGEHFEKEKEDEHTPDQIKMMQTQDIQYVTMKLTSEKRKIERLKAELHMLDAAEEVTNSHTFFVDDPKEVLNFDVASRLGTHPALMGRRTNRMKLETLKSATLPTIDKAALEKAQRQKAQKYAVLAKRLEREKQLRIIQEKMLLKKNLLIKTESKPERIKPATKDAPPVYRWKTERKR